MTAHPKVEELPGNALKHSGRVRALLLDRDGVLIDNIPYLADPKLVRPIPGVRRALASARAAGLLLGVVTNQSGIGRGIVAAEDVDRVNQLVDRKLGSFDVWQVCPHTPEDWCSCRKPAPGLVHRAADMLGLSPAGCAVIGDRLTDLQAAESAGALPILVPSKDTTAQERQTAAVVVATLGEAIEYVAQLEAV